MVLYLDAFETGWSWKISPDCSGYAVLKRQVLCAGKQHLSGKRGARF